MVYQFSDDDENEFVNTILMELLNRKLYKGLSKESIVEIFSKAVTLAYE